MLARLIEDDAPEVAVLDGISGLASGALSPEALSVVARQLDLLRSR